jgi:general secretion pathway protein G
MSTATEAKPLRRVRRDGQAGFTLVEMLVVITIIGLIMALVGPRVLGYLGESKTKTARIQIESLSAAMDLYFLDNGRYPSANEGLVALVQKPAGANGWNGPYLKSSNLPLDPWGHAYSYKIPGAKGAYEIASFGPGGPDAPSKDALITSSAQ